MGPLGTLRPEAQRESRQALQGAGVLNRWTNCPEQTTHFHPSLRAGAAVIHSRWPNRRPPNALRSVRPKCGPAMGGSGPVTKGGEGGDGESRIHRDRGKAPRLRPPAAGPHHGTHRVRQNSPPPTSVAAESCLRRQPARVPSGRQAHTWPRILAGRGSCPLPLR